MKEFSVRIKGIDGALGLRLDGLENAWNLHNPSRPPTSCQSKTERNFD